MEITYSFVCAQNAKIQLLLSFLGNNPAQSHLLFRQIIRMHIGFPDLISNRALPWNTVDLIHAIIPDNLAGNGIPFPDAYHGRFGGKSKTRSFRQQNPLPASRFGPEPDVLYDCG